MSNTTPNSKKSPLSYKQRYEAAAEAIYTNEIEGAEYTPEEIAIIWKYIDGTYNLDEAGDALMSLPYTSDRKPL